MICRSFFLGTIIKKDGGIGSTVLAKFTQIPQGMLKRCGEKKKKSTKHCKNSSKTTFFFLKQLCITGEVVMVTHLCYQWLHQRLSTRRFRVHLMTTKLQPYLNEGWWHIYTSLNKVITGSGNGLLPPRLEPMATYCQLDPLKTPPGINLCIRPASRRWCYTIMPPLTGWAYTRDDPCTSMKLESKHENIVQENAFPKCWPFRSNFNVLTTLEFQGLCLNNDGIFADRDFCYWGKTVSWPPYLHNENPYGNKDGLYIERSPVDSLTSAVGAMSIDEGELWSAVRHGIHLSLYGGGRQAWCRAEARAIVG